MKGHPLRWFLIPALTAILAAANGCGRDSRNELAVVGTGTSEEILKKLAEAYNRTAPGYRVTVPPSIGTSGAVKAVSSGEQRLGRVARHLKKEERGLTYIPFARDLVIFAAGTGAGVRALSNRQVIDIYSGRITNWKTVGGRDFPIRPLAREEADTSYQILAKAFPGFDRIKFSTQVKTVYHDFEMLEAFRNYPTALGWLTASSARAGIVPLTLEGIAPTPANLESGKYPYAVEYALICRGLPDAQAGKFIAFIFSPAGQKILLDNGLQTLPRQ